MICCFRVGLESHVFLIERLSCDVSVYERDFISVDPFGDVLRQSSDAGRNSEGMYISVFVLPSLLKYECDLRRIRISERLELREASAADHFMTYIGLDIHPDSLRKSCERHAIQNFRHRVLCCRDRLREHSYKHRSLTSDIHVDHAQRLDFLYMGLYPAAVSIASLLREYRIVGLHDSSHDGKDIVCSPDVSFRCRERRLSRKDSLLISVELIQTFGRATYKGRLLHLPLAPVVKLSIRIDGIHYRLLGMKIARECHCREERQHDKSCSSHKKWLNMQFRLQI